MKAARELLDLACRKLRLHYELMNVLEKEYLEAYHLRRAIHELYIRKRDQGKS